EEETELRRFPAAVRGSLGQDRPDDALGTDPDRHRSAVLRAAAARRRALEDARRDAQDDVRGLLPGDSRRRQGCEVPFPLAARQGLQPDADRLLTAAPDAAGSALDVARAAVRTEDEVAVAVRDVVERDRRERLDELGAALGAHGVLDASVDHRPV